MFKRSLIIAYRLLWYALAIITLGTAILVTMLRLALPQVENYREEIQIWLSEYMRYPVTINHIRAEWEGWTPHLFLNQVDLYTPDSHEMITRLDSAHISIAPVVSILQGKIVPYSLSVNGLQLELTQNPDDTISIGIDSKNRITMENDVENTALSEWFLTQKYIVLENTTLSWRDHKTNQETLTFSNVRLELETDEHQARLNVFVNPNNNDEQALNIYMLLKGNALGAEWDGDIYIKAKNVLPKDLMRGLPVIAHAGNADLQFWSSWKKARLINFSATLEYRDFSIDYNNAVLPVNLARLYFDGERRDEDDWLFNLQTKALETAHGDWAPGKYQLLVKKSTDDTRHYHAWLSYLKLEDILPFLDTTVNSLGISPGLDWSLTGGELTQTRIDINDTPPASNSLRFSTRFRNLGGVNHNNNDWVKGLDGSIHMDNKSVKIELDTEQAQVNTLSFFEQPFTVEDIGGVIEFNHQTVPELKLHQTRFIANGLSIKTSGNIRFEEPSPFIDLLARMDRGDTGRIIALLPVKTDPELKKWLARALSDNSPVSSDLLYRGYLSDFPFKQEEGRFQAVLNIADVNLEYNLGWPPVDNADVETLFNNETVRFSFNSGHIFKARINNIDAVIKDITQENKTLSIKSDVSAHTDDIRHFIEQSPLNDSSFLSEIKHNLVGNAHIKTNLNIPMSEEETTFNGTIRFSEASFKWKPSELGLEKINGDVHFNNNDFWTDKIIASYRGNPVEVNIPRQPEKKPDTKSVIVSGLANESFIAEQLELFFPASPGPGKSVRDYFSGQSLWEITIGTSQQESGLDSELINIRSDLTGTAIDLPAPIGKLEQESRPLQIRIGLKPTTREIHINYDNIVLTGTVDESRVDLQTALKHLDLSAWLPVLNQKKTYIAAASNENNPSLSFNLSIEELKILGNRFKDVQIDLSHPDDAWEVAFHSDDIKGTAKFIRAEDGGHDRLWVNLAHIIISDFDKQAEDTPVTIKNFPELDIKIDKTIYKENDLGQAILLTTNTDDGININQLNFSKPGFVINASGKWTQTNNVDYTESSASLQADSISEMLNTFNYAGTNIEGGRTKIELQADWQGTPMDFSLKNTNGKLNMDIGKGRFLDIDPSVGRLFGLLSVQMLPRRLALDFTDLFTKGFAFNSINGNFNLQGGDAYTNDLQMQGVSADISISGRTGLSAEDYDQIATVTPKISSSLPMAGALFGPIGIGIGAAIYLGGELLNKNINTMLDYQYSIQGNWNNPDVQRITE